MEKSNLLKRILFLAIISLSGFAASYYFLKTNQDAPVANKSDDAKQGLTVISLLTEQFDFENEESATSEKAASGTKSIKLSPQTEYGYNIKKAITDVPAGTTEIKVELTCWSSKAITGVYVLSIDDAEGKNVLWDSKPLAYSTTEAWTKQQLLFTLKPEFMKAGNTLKLYPWNRAKEEFYIDNVSIQYLGLGVANPTSSNFQSSTNFFFDFEKTDGLTGTESIKETTAHSGKKACDLTGGKEYGPLIIKSVSLVSSTPLTKISASVWIYPLTDKPNAVLTAAITNAKGENLFWDGKSTENKPYKKNQWTKINAGFNIPPGKVSFEDKIQINVWNKGRTDIIIDDMEIVYGESASKRGEPSLIDFSSIYDKKFTPQKNKPPFKTVFFQKQELTKVDNNVFTSNDQFIVGDFVKDKNNLDELICIKDGKATMYYFTPETHELKVVLKQHLSADSILKSIKKPDTYNDNSVFKPSDITFVGDYFGNGKTEILKLNTDWRFDMKLIDKTKTEYSIIANADFKGYSNDYNPKYYEFTKIISGRFIRPSQSSLLVISCNCADAKFDGIHCNELENLNTLPNSIGLCSIENK